MTVVGNTSYNARMVQSLVGMRSTLEDMMRDADDDKTREAIRRCMEQIDRA